MKNHQPNQFVSINFSIMLNKKFRHSKNIKRFHFEQTKWRMNSILRVKYRRSIIYKFNFFLKNIYERIRTYVKEMSVEISKCH